MVWAYTISYAKPTKEIRGCKEVNHNLTSRNLTKCDLLNHDLLNRNSVYYDSAEATRVTSISTHELVES